MSTIYGFGARYSLNINYFRVRNSHRFLRVTFLWMWLILPSAGFAQSTSTPVSSVIELDYAITAALDHSLELAGIRAQSEAIRAASSQAGAARSDVVIKGNESSYRYLRTWPRADDADADRSEPEFSISGQAQVDAGGCRLQSRRF